MRNPHLTYRQSERDKKFWESEFGFGVGMYPDPAIDYSAGGSKSGIPIADPDGRTQLMELQAMRRTDTADPNDGEPANLYHAGNPDRFGAQPPLVRERRRPAPPKVVIPKPSRMVREW